MVDYPLVCPDYENAPIRDSIPDLHAASACPACSDGTPCRVVTRGHARYWDLYREDPGKWGPILVADALKDRDKPPAFPVGPRPRGQLIPQSTEFPPDRHAVYARFGRKARWKIDGGCVLCACDSAQFVPLQMMLASLLLSHDVPVTVVDLGLEPRQRAWLERQPVTVRECPDLVMPRDEAMWQTWNKPVYFDLASHDRVLWLDNDILVSGDLRPIFAAMESGPVLVEDHFARDQAIMHNDAALYERFPAPSRCGNVCGGIVGVDRSRDRTLLFLWFRMLEESASDPNVRAMIAWWDQGCLLWAIETLGQSVYRMPAWNTAGRPQQALEITYRSPAEMIARMPGAAAIVHYQGNPKPYGWAPEYRLSLRPAPDLSVLILGHEPFTRPEREWLTPINLTEYDPDQSWGEVRAYDRDWPELATGWVGLATFSWTRKYEDSVGALAPWEFGELDLSDPNVVHCALATTNRTWVDSPDWVVHMESASPGITPLIAELRRVSGLVEVQPSCWSNNFVMHRSVFADLVAFTRSMMAYFRGRYPTCPYLAAVPEKEWGYLGEAIGVHWLASRRDLTFREMRWPPVTAVTDFVPSRDSLARPRMAAGWVDFSAVARPCCGG